MNNTTELKHTDVKLIKLKPFYCSFRKGKYVYLFV